MLSPWAFPYRDNYIKKRRAADLPRAAQVAEDDFCLNRIWGYLQRLRVGDREPPVGSGIFNDKLAKRHRTPVFKDYCNDIISSRR